MTSMAQKYSTYYRQPTPLSSCSSGLGSLLGERPY